MAEQSAQNVVTSTQSMGEPAPVDVPGKSLTSNAIGGGGLSRGAEDEGSRYDGPEQSTNLAKHIESGPNGVNHILNFAEKTSTVRKNHPSLVLVLIYDVVSVPSLSYCN